MGQTTSSEYNEEDVDKQFDNFCGSDEEEDDSSYEYDEESDSDDDEGDDNEEHPEHNDLPSNDARSNPHEIKYRKGDEVAINKDTSRSANTRPQDINQSPLPSLPRVLSPDDITRDDIYSITKADLRNASPGKDFIASFDLDAHLPTIAFVFAESAELRKMHFTLVPARMKEQRFFAILFYILWRKISAASADLLHQEEEALVEEVLGEQQQQQQQSPGEANTRRILFDNMHDDALTNGTAEVSAIELQKQLKEKTKENAYLRKVLRETQMKLEHAKSELSTAKESFRQQQHQQTNSESVSEDKKEEKEQDKPSPSSSHKGKWVMDKDSREFLELDEELKNNLRAEKEKRLADVRAQMKFILDTDDISGSFGEWDCCGKSEYHAQGCA